MITHHGICEPAYAAGCEGNPPPLHVHGPGPESIWIPFPRPVAAATPAGPVWPHTTAASLGVGEDPTDPTTQRVPRVATAGMMDRFNLRGVAT